MLRSKDGCHNRDSDHGIDFCFDSKGKNPKRYDDQPIESWIAAAVLALIEA